MRWRNVVLTRANDPPQHLVRPDNQEQPRECLVKRDFGWQITPDMLYPLTVWWQPTPSLKSLRLFAHGSKIQTESNLRAPLILRKVGQARDAPIAQMDRAAVS